ncbi:hypothetical protein E2C01_065745 [Portunus trituberculatus]|uniref:Uncharacterized protein n=1 Tax=Portunus trituberculatus TaxID=210409 RepID=A0A5B7HQF4_PORTR|nr:hypothetical protein [Portunus trituberculatus]
MCTESREARGRKQRVRGMMRSSRQVAVKRRSDCRRQEEGTWYSEYEGATGVAEGRNTMSKT